MQARNGGEFSSYTGYKEEGRTVRISILEGFFLARPSRTTYVFLLTISVIDIFEAVLML